MKKILLIVTTLLSVASFAQKLTTRTGEIKFEASMPALEEVAATSKTASAVLNTTNGEFATLLLIKSFKFKVALMEEHFNENYMESIKYPKATFKGKILNFDTKKLTATKTSYDIEGDLMIHGVTKKVKTKIFLSQLDGKIVAATNFTIKIDDYKIEIPSLVRDKIAKTASIACSFTF